jgi:hypothetical protein
MFHYVGVTYANGETLVTPDYARDFSQMGKFDQQLRATWCEVNLKPNEFITGAIGSHDLVQVYDNAQNIYTNAIEKNFVLRGITFIVSTINEADWSTSPAYNVTCGDPPGAATLAPEATAALNGRYFIPGLPEGGYGLIDTSVELGVDSGHDTWLCHMDVLGESQDSCSMLARCAASYVELQKASSARTAAYFSADYSSAAIAVYQSQL